MHHNWQALCLESPREGVGVAAITAVFLNESKRWLCYSANSINNLINQSNLRVNNPCKGKGLEGLMQ